jgi:hypothetical protein
MSEKNKSEFHSKDLEERRSHNAPAKGREKDKVRQLVNKTWESFDEWDDAPVETFQKFRRR